MSGPFAIVEFTADKSVYVVPTSWLEDDETFWAPYTNPDRFERAVKKAERPQNDWQKYKVRILQVKGSNESFSS
jgi:hypothetical protein